MSLVTAKEVAKAIHFDKYGFIGTFFGWLLMKLLNISAINNIYNRKKDDGRMQFQALRVVSKYDSI